MRSLARAVPVVRPFHLAACGFAGAALLMTAPHAFAMNEAVVRQRLGLSRASVQRLRVDTATGAIPLEVDGRAITLRVAPASLRAPGFRVLVQDASGLHDVEAPAPATVRGTVDEFPGAIAGGSIQDGRLSAAIALPDGRLYYVQPLSDAEPGADREQHVVYSAADAVEGEGTCAASEPQVPVAPLSDAEGPELHALKIADIAFDTDFEFYTLNGQTTDVTIQDIENVLAQVNVVYERDCELRHDITTIIVRTTQADPYTATAADAILAEFRNLWNDTQSGIVRDVAHLMTGKDIDGGTIGIAAVGAVCNRTRGYGLSQSRYIANMSRRTALTAHELGHNWNAVHCDAADTCHIMCSGINGCDGIGLPNFEPQGIAAITNFKASRTCLANPPVAVGEAAGASGVVFAPPSPTPFHGQTTLSFRLPRSAPVILDVYDVAGHRVARLLDGVRPAGLHQVVWRGRDGAGQRVRSGVYYAVLNAAGSKSTRMLVLLR